MLHQHLENEKTMIGLIGLTFLLTVVSAGESRGFNDKIAWLNSIAEAKKVSAESNKPVFVLIHKTWCGACKALKSVFAGSDKIAAASKDFVMVNLEDDEEPSESAFKPDGGYIPRGFFLRNGEVDPSLSVPNGNPKYKYYYSSEAQVLQAFTAALAANKPKSEL
jgi:protein-disulfide reductase (glutathione)